MFAGLFLCKWFVKKKSTDRRYIYIYPDIKGCIKVTKGFNSPDKSDLRKDLIKGIMKVMRR